MIEACNLTKRSGDKLAVNDLSVTVKPRIVTGFPGPNGARESTRIRLLAGLDAPTAAEVTVNSRRHRLPGTAARRSASCSRRARYTPGIAFNHLLAPRLCPPDTGSLKQHPRDSSTTCCAR